MGKQCAACKQELPAPAYSKSQWKKKGSRYCLKCVAANTAEKVAASEKTSKNASKKKRTSDVPGPAGNSSKSKSDQVSADKLAVVLPIDLSECTPFEEFPHEVIQNICEHMRVPDILRLGCTCRHAARVVCDDWTWKRVLLRGDNFPRNSGSFSFKELAFHCHYSLGMLQNRSNKGTRATLPLKVEEEPVLYAPRQFAVSCSTAEQNAIDKKFSVVSLDFPPVLPSKTSPGGLFNLTKIRTQPPSITHAVFDVNHRGSLLAAVQTAGHGLHIIHNEMSSYEKSKSIPVRAVTLKHFYKGYAACLDESESALHVWPVHTSKDTVETHVEKRQDAATEAALLDAVEFDTGHSASCRTFYCPREGCYRSFATIHSAKQHYAKKHIKEKMLAQDYRTAPPAATKGVEVPDDLVQTFLDAHPSGGGWTDLQEKDGSWMAVAYGKPTLHCCVGHEDCIYLCSTFAAEGSYKLACFNITSMEKQLYELTSLPCCITADDDFVVVGTDNNVQVFESRGGSLVNTIDIPGWTSVKICSGTIVGIANARKPRLIAVSVYAKASEKLSLMCDAQPEMFACAGHVVVASHAKPASKNTQLYLLDLHTGKLLRKWKCPDRVSYLTLDTTGLMLIHEGRPWEEDSLTWYDFTPPTPLSVNNQRALEHQRAKISTPKALPAQQDPEGEDYGDDGDYVEGGGYYDEDGYWVEGNDEYYDEGDDGFDEFDDLELKTTANPGRSNWW